MIPGTFHYSIGTVPVQASAPVVTFTSLTPGVNLPAIVLGISMSALIRFVCLRSGMTNLISSIETALVRSQVA